MFPVLLASIALARPVHHTVSASPPAAYYVLTERAVCPAHVVVDPGGRVVEVTVEGCAAVLADVQAAGVPVSEVNSARQRMDAFDRNAPMQDQFNWLEAAGFADVDIVYRNYFWAVFFGRKPE